MATIATEIYTVEGEGVTLDLIIWRRYGQAMPGLLERTLAQPANQHLEHAPAELPLGTVVHLPIEAPRPAAVERVIDLFG